MSADTRRPTALAPYGRTVHASMDWISGASGRGIEKRLEDRQRDGLRHGNPTAGSQAGSPGDGRHGGQRRSAGKPQARQGVTALGHDRYSPARARSSLGILARRRFLLLLGAHTARRHRRFALPLHLVALARRAPALAGRLPGIRGRLDLVLSCPGPALLGRETAAVPPALLGGKAATGMMLAGKGLAIGFGRGSGHRQTEDRRQMGQERDATVEPMADRSRKNASQVSRHGTPKVACQEVTPEILCAALDPAKPAHNLQE